MVRGQGRASGQIRRPDGLIVHVTERADAELNSAVAYLRGSSLRAADALHLAVERALDSLEQFPNRGRAGQIDGTRELVVPGAPYVIVYSVSGDAVFVARIRHVSQDPSP